MSPAVELLNDEVVRLRAREADLLRTIARYVEGSREVAAKCANLRIAAHNLLSCYDDPPADCDIEPWIDALRKALVQ